MWRKRMLGLGLVVALSGCSLTTPIGRTDGTGATPEHAVVQFRTTTPGSLAVVDAVDVLSTRAVGARTLVIYRTRKRTGLATASTHTTLGYRLAEPDGAGWKVVASGNEISVAAPPPAELSGGYGIRYAFPPSAETEVFGQAGSTVARVEATLGNGAVVGDAVTNGAFLILTPGAAEVCEIRALDALGGILQRVDVVATAPPVRPELIPCAR